MRHTPDAGTEATPEKKRFDLSVAQVSGSALAAVLAAKLASTLGVYGTILGAGVISVIATCGGPVLQHLLKRTGEQMRGATAAAGKPGRLPRCAEPVKHVEPVPYEERPGGEFGEPTTHGTRMRGWKRPVLGAAVVFLLAMGGITAYELTSGQDLGGTKGSTTFGSAVRGQADGAAGGGAGKGEQRPSGDGTPAAPPSAGGGAGKRTGGTGTPVPGRTPGTGTATPDGTATPTPAPSGSTRPTDGATTPPPSPSSPPTTPSATDAAGRPVTPAE
ncbi:hypothetical protein ACIGO8_24695 [Streptomyces sp. NPDC053493]|uniref:hypothetical protein n=1 Tax=Streptomyces sp. NPDC053493 TaxID=3365705 RepID=UPI0037D7294A